MGYRKIDPQDVSVQEFHHFLLGSVVPRPIALASTIDKSGKVNLSPFSFFNAFSANPPILVFSPARRVRNNTTKHTLENILEVKEVVINICDFTMVQQVSLSSTEYEKGVNEFLKADFTQEISSKISPPRVKESPIAFECKVNDVIALGKDGGAGNLVICEVLLAHYNEKIMSGNQLDYSKLDVVARLGSDDYCRVIPESIFSVEKPIRNRGIGVDMIPIHVKSNPNLTGNHLGQLGNVEKLPSLTDVNQYKERRDVKAVLSEGKSTSEIKDALVALAISHLERNEVILAWNALLIEV